MCSFDQVGYNKIWIEEEKRGLKWSVIYYNKYIFEQLFCKNTFRVENVYVYFKNMKKNI